VRKPFYFFLLPQYWFPSLFKKKIEEHDQSEVILFDDNFEMIPENLAWLEEERKVLEVKGLWKTFGKFVAVENLNINMYQGQIFALLGHNGAGKTTTINCLSGMLSKSKGKAEVLGVDVFKNPGKLRKMMGVCP